MLPFGGEHGEVIASVTLQGLLSALTTKFLETLDANGALANLADC